MDSSPFLSCCASLLHESTSILLARCAHLDCSVLFTRSPLQLKSSSNFSLRASKNESCGISSSIRAPCFFAVVSSIHVNRCLSPVTSVVWNVGSAGSLSPNSSWRSDSENLKELFFFFLFQIGKIAVSH